MSPTLTAEQSALLEWGRVHHRELPWRLTRDPWAVLVSELMLQQTQVARVVPRYHDFLDRFPDVGSCAAASPAEVVRRWAGLGYNRRAVNLHRASVLAMERHAGVVPDDLDALLDLPGIGPYTARAVLAFAFEHDVAVLDTNVARVLARRTGRALRPSEAQSAADSLVPAGAGWAWNQAMLDLGAQVCRSRGPDCDACPWLERCGWRTTGRSEPDPARGSAGVSSGQSRFEGSDRQGRGRLVDALRRGPVRSAELARAAGWPDDPERASRIADTLVRDGLAVRCGDVLELP